MNTFLEELKWRGLIQDATSGIEAFLQKECTGYIGFDPSAASLHVGSLVQIMLLTHFQRAGHKPIALVGGATGMIGDPSGKSEERNLLHEEVLLHNLECQKKQLEKFLDFGNVKNQAEIVNNYEWFREMKLLPFLRDVGKHLTVNYMLAKDSVQSRLEKGISFTEFTYQLLQGFDFYVLYKTKNCSLQMGGSDQWGNILTGSELIRRMEGGEAYGLTCPLVTKTDGGKFGKTETGTVWLDPSLTSPYLFYQFWINTSDSEAEKYIKYFTVLPKVETEGIITAHRAGPHLRMLQQELAREVTARVHGETELQKAVSTSEILFGKGTRGQIQGLSEKEILEIFSGVSQGSIDYEKLKSGMPVQDFLSESGVLPSKSEARRMIAAGGASLNFKRIISPDMNVDQSHMLSSGFLVVQIGKKKFHLVKMIYS